MTSATDNQQASTGQPAATLTQGRSWAVLALSLALLALGIWLVSWLTQPSYMVLARTNQMDDMAVIARELQNNNIKYQYNSSSGEMSVPAEQIHQARLALAAKGLPAATSYISSRSATRNANASLLKQEANRLPQENLEQELATTIASIDPVQSARVHLALIDASRDGTSQQSRASVVVRLYPERRLNSGQINAISHLVASSTHGLALSRIAIVDQTGRLLKSAGASDVNPLTTSQFDYRQQIEQDYIERIEKVLKPIVGAGNIRCQVTAVMDFDSVTATENNVATLAAGTLRRLSVTVLVDDKEVNSASGGRRVSRTQKELERIGVLIKEAIGYREARGDKVNVINEPFSVTPATPSSWTSDIVGAWSGMTSQARYIIGAALLLLVLIIFTVNRSHIRRAGPGHVTSNDSQQLSTGSMPVPNVQREQQNTFNDAPVAEQPDNIPLFEQKMHEVRELVLHDPKRVAQVLKQWVKEG